MVGEALAGQGVVDSGADRGGDVVCGELSAQFGGGCQRPVVWEVEGQDVHAVAGQVVEAGAGDELVGVAFAGGGGSGGDAEHRVPGDRDGGVAEYLPGDRGRGRWDVGVGDEGGGGDDFVAGCGQESGAVGGDVAALAWVDVEEVVALAAGAGEAEEGQGAVGGGAGLGCGGGEVAVVVEVEGDPQIRCRGSSLGQRWRGTVRRAVVLMVVSVAGVGSGARRRGWCQAARACSVVWNRAAMWRWSPSPSKWTARPLAG